MGRRCGALTIGVVLAAVLAMPARSAAGGDDLSLAVLLDNRAGVPATVLDVAKTEVARIVRRAGMHVDWVTDESQPTEPHAVMVRLIVQPKFQGRTRLESQIQMGAAPESARECGAPVYLFFDQIVRF